MRQKPLLLQTSDAVRYYDMLQATSKTVRRYCELKDYDYEQFVGIRRGYWPWQATFNRVYLLRDIINRPRRGWVLYMDADAYIQDLSFDLEDFLCQNEKGLLIATPSGASEHVYDINAGVIAINLSHRYAELLITKWCQGVDAISDNELFLADNEWPVDMPDDQIILQWIIRDTAEISDALSQASPTLMNAPGASFIRQYLRAFDAELVDRVRNLEQIVSSIVSTGPSPKQGPVMDRGPSTQHYAIVEGLYRAILRRPSDEYGRRDFSQMLFERGIAQGVSEMVRLMLSGAEYNQNR